MSDNDHANADPRATCAHHGPDCVWQVGRDGVHVYPEKQRPTPDREWLGGYTVAQGWSDEEYERWVPRDARDD